MDTSQTILVVDDNPTNIAMLLKPLKGVGYNVLSANDGFKAVTMATEQMPDLILLDMVMPGRDGLEVCRLLKAQETTASIPIIFVTGESESDKIVSAFAAGGVDYTTKPFRIDEVLARVSVHLSLQRAEREAAERNVKAMVEKWVPSDASSEDSTVPRGASSSAASNVDQLPIDIGKGLDQLERDQELVDASD